MIKIMKLLMMVVMLSVLFGCAPCVTPLMPGAENVIISLRPPLHCRQIMCVMAHQGGRNTYQYMLEKNAMNKLTNKALQIHANYIYITSIYSNATLTELKSLTWQYVTVKGVAYYCPRQLPCGIS